MTFAIAPCASCKANIVWCLDATTGKRFPVDELPVIGGNVRVIARIGKPPQSKVIGAVIDLFDPDDDGTRYVSHFVTCPNAGDWRKRGRPMSAEELDTPGPKRWRHDHK